MKKNLNRLLLLFTVVTMLSTSPGCKSKPNDSKIKSDVETALRTDPQTSGLAVSVTDGVATVSGEVKDASAQAKVTILASGVKGVKSVQNNVTVAAVAPPVVITPDDPLSTGVRDATKDFPSVSTSVREGVIYVTGEIKSADWKRLKMALDALRPKRVDASGLKIS